MIAFPRLEQLPIADPAQRRPGTVDIWCYRYAADVEADRLPRALAVLSHDELLQHSRFRFARDGDLYLATRILVRATLSRYAAVNLSEWQFTRTAYGKPLIAGPAIGVPLQFNLSNVHGLVVCAVTTTATSLGIDVEPVVPRADALDIARSHFAPTEVTDLLAQAQDALDERFTVYWTLKESLVKALGGGLSLPLSQFAFQLDGGKVSLKVSPGLSLEPANWQFALLGASPRHTVAISAETGGAPLVLRAADFALS